MVRIQFMLGVLALTSLMFAPGLCLNGVLSHPCEPEHGEEAPCHHETDCSSDPCNVVFVRPDSVSRLGPGPDVWIPWLQPLPDVVPGSFDAAESAEPLPDASPPGEAFTLLTGIVMLI